MGVTGRLSEQQQFILAWLARHEDDMWDLRMAFERGGGDAGTAPPAAALTELSWAVAREFDPEDGARIERLFDEAQDHAERQGLDFHSDEVTMYMIAQMADREKKDRLAASHRSSFSRSLDRLEDRGLILKQPRRRVALTDEGRKVGAEILEQHRDGRYSISFDGLE